MTNPSDTPQRTPCPEEAMSCPAEPDQLMITPADRLITWARSHIEIGAVASIVATVAAYVGQRFYRSYYAFHLLEGINIDVPLVDSARVFAFVLVLSAAVVLLALKGNDARPASAISALSDNVPLFVVLVLVGALATSFYLENVEVLSRWLDQKLQHSTLRNDALSHVPTVISFLHKWMISGPIVLSAVVVGVASMFRWSFSNHLLRQSPTVRYAYFALYVVLLLAAASAAGEADAYLERTGFLGRAEVKILLNDGTTIGNSPPAYLIAKADSTYYIAAAGNSDTPVTTWAIPQGAIKLIEFSAADPSSLAVPIRKAP